MRLDTDNHSVFMLYYPLIMCLKYCNKYDVVCVESLNMRDMANHGFDNGKATLDNGYGMFLNMLEYKLCDRGKYFVKVDKWFPPSQVSS